MSKYLFIFKLINILLNYENTHPFVYSSLYKDLSISLYRMNNKDFENIIHIENGLYCLNDIAEKLILSKNVKEYIKKIKNKEWIKGNYYISKDDM